MCNRELQHKQGWVSCASPTQCVCAHVCKHTHTKQWGRDHWGGGLVHFSLQPRFQVPSASYKAARSMPISLLSSMSWLSCLRWQKWMFSIDLSSGLATSSLLTKCDCTVLEPSKIHTAASVSSAWWVHRRRESPLEEAVPPPKVCLSLLRIAAQTRKEKPNICNMNSVVSSGAWHSWGCHISGLQFYRNKKTMCVNHAVPEIRSEFWSQNEVNHGFITRWPLQAGLQTNEIAIVQRPDSEGAL